MPADRPGVVYGKRARPDGRWQGYVVLSSGKRRTVLRRSEAEMRAGVDALAAQLESGREPPAEDPTVTAYLPWWIERRRDGLIGRKPLAPSTVLRYDQLARLQIVPHVGRHKMSRVRVGHIEGLDDALRRAGCSGTIRLQVFRLLHVMFEHAVRRGVVARNPCDLMDPPQRDVVPDRELDTDAVAAVIRAAKGHPQEAMLWTAIGTGIRQGELFALRWKDDVDLDAARIMVHEKVQWLPGMGQVRSAPKTRAGVRAMALPPIVVAALRAHKQAQERAGRPNPLGLVFPSATGTHFQASNWNKNVWLAWKTAAGIDPTTPFRALTRKAHHSLMVSLGVDPETVRRRAGHTSVVTTFEHYILSVSAADEQAAKKLDGALRRLAGPAPEQKRRSRTGRRVGGE